MTPTPASTPLLADIRLLIDGARQRVANAVNAELTQLYWHIGRRISTELLQGQRAEYGKQVVAELARQLTVDFGKGWSEQQLRHCMRLAEMGVSEFLCVRHNIPPKEFSCLVTTKLQRAAKRPCRNLQIKCSKSSYLAR